MFRLLKLVVFTAAIGIAGLAAAFVYARNTGLGARATAGELETRVARMVRSWAVPPEVRAMANPVPPSDEVRRTALEHYADHCASCHANDGSGQTSMGQSLFPPAPDMRGERTQGMSDGELFHVIEHGVRFTGMPAWSTGTPDGERASWELVHFIRHLPRLTPEELETMKGINPRPPADVRQELEEERFLQGF